MSREMTYTDAKRHLARRQDGWAWTREDVEAQNIVCAVEGVEPPESLQHLRNVYNAEVERIAGLARPRTLRARLADWWCRR